MSPFAVYVSLVQQAFIDDVRGPAADALRRVVTALNSSSVYRHTPEFDELCMFEPKITLKDIILAGYQKFVIENSDPAVEYNYLAERYECKYLTKNGAKCTFGLLLPDGHESQRGECNVSDLIKEYPNLWADDVLAIYNHDMGKNSYPYKLHIDQLQKTLHDDMVDASTGKWKVDQDGRRKVYQNIAVQYGIELPS